MKTISFDSVLGASTFVISEPDAEGWQRVTVEDDGPRIGDIRRATAERPFEYRIYGPDTWPMAQAKPLLLHQVVAALTAEEEAAATPTLEETPE